MRRHGKAGLTLAIGILLAGLLGGLVSRPIPKAGAADEPEAQSAEEQREKQIIERFLIVLEKGPRRGTALDRIYGYHVERGSLDKLIKDYRQRTAKEPADGIAWMIVGLLESQRGKDAEAVAAFRQAEKHLPTNSLASYYLGQSLVMVGQPDAAAEAFERAITRKPARTDLLDIFQALGRVYQRAQQSEKALAVWARLEEIFPEDRRVQEQIASTLTEEGQFDQALPRYEKLVKGARDPYQKATFRMEAAELKVRLKQTPKALADFEAMLTELNPDSWLYREVRRKIEDVFLRNDDLAGLAKYYEGWLKKTPDDIDAIARLAKTLASQGRMPESRSWLEKALVKAPSRRELRQALIEQLVFEQKYGDAAAQYEAMDKVDPNNPDTLREWGKLLLRDTARPEAERKQAAYGVWKRLLEKRPKDPVITAQVADLVRAAGLNDEAIALYKKAIELAPESPQYREYLGEYYHMLKRKEDALATWRPIAEGANRNAKNLARLGEVLSGFGYRKEAVAAFTDAVGLEKDDFNLRLRYAELLHLDERHDDALVQLDAAAKLIGNAEEAEGVLLAQIKIYQATDTLTSRTEKLQKELDASKDATAERWHRLARYYEANRQMAEATAAIKTALEKDGKSVPILASAARIHETGGNLLLAADTNRKLAALDRRFRTEYLTAVAKLEARLGRRAEAMQAGRDLLAAAPGNPDHYKFFAELCFQLGEGEEGLESLRRSVRANPSEPQGLLTLANALAERFRSGEAIELLWRAFEKTNELEGKLSIVTRLTELYLQNNQFDRLLERLERERREADKQREMTLCIGQAYQAAGDLGTARQQLERLLTENSRDTQLLQQLSQLSENEGDSAVALKYQKQLVQAAPNNHDAQLRLAQLLVKAGESEEAAAIWVKLVAGEPQPHRNLQAIDALFTHHKEDTVLAITRKLLAQKPGNWELLYREGVALAALDRTEEATRRFQAVLDLRLPDDEEGAALKASKKQKPGRAAGASTSRISFVDEVPLQRRTQNIWQIRAYTGLDPRYGNWVANQQSTWMPGDYGQVRLAALGWLMGFAQKQNRNDAFLKEHRPGKGAAPQAVWDWYYLQQLRQDNREIYAAARELARSPDPAAQWAYLHSLTGRTVATGQYIRPNRPGSTDNTPPLPAEELERVVAAFQRLRKEKPQWLTSDVLTPTLTELKRAKRTKDADQVYHDAVATASASGQVGVVQQVLGVAAERGDIETVLKFFDRLDKLQTGSPTWMAGQQPIRLATNALSDAMRVRADAKAHREIPKLYEVYLAASRRQRQASGKVASRSLSSNFQGNNYSVYVGKNRRYIQIDYPTPNDYLDSGAIELLRNVFEFYKRDDLLSDVFAHFRQELDKAAAPDKVYLRLTLAALYWWNREHEQALTEMNAASDLAPSDVNLRLEVARLRENNNEFQEALAILESITPLDHTTMQQREMAALRLTVRTGNVERARQAADRLFGLRLDAETQVKLAAQMHQLGMHDAAEKVLARAQRQAGHRTAALLSLMHQYQNQNQIDLAVQIARQLLRKGPSLNFSPYNYNNQQSDGRSEAIQVLVRSGMLGEMIERAEAQLKSSPRSLELHQTLLDYYKAAGDKNKLKDIAERMAKVRPDDGKVQYQIAQQLQQIGEFAASAERYKAALRKEPMLFAYRYWEIQQVFDQARKSEELIQLFDEIDIKAMGGNYWAFMNMLQPLFSQDRTRTQGLKLFKKVWDAFPQERAQMMGYLYQNELWQTPEIYDYARQAVIPKGDDPVEPWRACDDVISYGGDGRVTGVVTRLLEAARKQNRLTPLTREIEQMVAKRPEWSGGKALLAVLNLQRGKTAEARRMWRELLDDKKTPMPMWPRFILGQEIEEYESMRDLALETYEGAIEETLDDGNMQFSYSPVRRLVHLYQDMGRKAEARALMLKCIRQVGYEFDAGYAAYRRIYDTSEVANTLCEMGYPVDAVRMCSEVLEDTETIEAAVNWNGPWMKQHAEQALKRALKGLKSATLAEAVHDLLAPRPLTHPSPSKGGEGSDHRDAGPAAPVLDLLLLVQPRDLPKARLTSMLEQALREAVKKPELRKEVQATLAKLAADYPGDLSVQIASALEALGEENSERAGPAVDRLCKLVESLPLEKLSDGRRANSRQRAEAVRQLGLWLVARQCLRRPALRAAGEMLGNRAVEAGRRQIEPHYALAMLREWGQIELDRGDRKAAQQRWAEMLDTIAPPPAPAKRAAQKPKPAAPAVPAAQKVGSATQLAPGLPGENQCPPASRGLGVIGVVRIYDEMLAAAPPVAVAPPARVQAAPPSLVPTLTNQQFEQVSQVATLAAEQKMFALSMKAVREALRGGPPVGNAANIGRSRVVFVGGGGSMTVADNNNQDNVSVAQHLSELVPQWRRGGVPATDIYAVLADIVLPESRPAEVFLYTPATEADPSQPGNSVGQLLAETAVQAGRLDDLRRRVAARQDKPLGELNARVLLAQAAWAAGNEDRFGELLKEFGQRLQKDSLRHTAALICQVAAPALAKPKLTATALPVLERAAKNLLGAGADGPAMNTMLYLARHDFEHGKVKEGKARLKEVSAVALRTLVRNGGNGYQIQQMQRLVQEYIRAGLLAEALDLFGMAVDLPKEQRSQIPRDALYNLIAAFGRQFAARPAQERYDLLKGWTLPTILRRSVRILGGFVPTDAPPDVFGKFPIPAGGVWSNAGQLIEAAREIGKLDELAAEVQKLDPKKVENAAALYALIQIARGRSASVEEILRQHLQQVQKKAFAPEPIRSPYYWNGNEQNGPGVDWTDYLLTRACLGEARLAGIGEMLADLLVRMAQRSQNSTAIAHVRRDLALSRSANALPISPQRKQGKEEPLLALRADKYPSDPGLAPWHPASYIGGWVRRTGTLSAWWVAHEGHVAQLFGPDHQFLIFDYPLTGSFEFSVDAYEGGWSEGLLGYAGLVFEPTPNSILWSVGHHEQLSVPRGTVYHEDFNRLTIQVEPGKLRWLFNDRLVHEQTDPGATSPWLALFAQRERHSVFRNLQIHGTPQIPREVHLSDGDRLEGWVCSFYNESQPPRLNKQPDDNEEAAGQPQPKRDPSSFDWYARDGEIHGRNLGTTGRPSNRASARHGMGSLLSYFRPLRPGETIRYEFFYQPGEVMVYPSLGRLAFLLEPERVRLHWLGESDDNDWTGLAPDNAVDEPGHETRPLPLKANDWNQVRLSLTADRVKIELNGGVVYERKLEADNSRSFGLFHYKDRTAAQVRNVVLTGDWPQKLSEKDQTDFFVSAGPVTDGAARRAVIGDKFFLLSAGHVLRQARAAKPDEAYAILRAWVLPNQDHTVFQMSGEFTPADPAPPIASAPPAGRRVLTGGELQAPALELVALAKKLGKLDELAESLQKPTLNGQERGRLAMLALVRAAQERDDQARTALSELTRLVTPLPLIAPMWMRWPELIAASGTMNRPALRGAALALLDVLVRHMEQGTEQQTQLPGRDLWVRRVRQARAAAQVLGLPAEQRAAFGTDPGLKYWDPVSFNKAMPRGIGSPLTHWSVENNVIKHYPGRAQDYLYLRTPLRGDFEVNCELTTFGWREAHLGYGGLRFDLIYTRKTFNLQSFDRRIRIGQIEPELKPLGDWYRMRLVVRDGTWTVYVNDRKMCEEPLPDEADPWLVLHADHQITSGIRNLKITGQPRVPESVSLSALPDLTGWRSYDDGPWQKRGDTIVGQGYHTPRDEALTTNPHAQPQPRTWQERALHYNRPLLEDGEIEYDFFYEPDKFHGHPALDRLVFLLDPDGVRVHWLTNGVHDRTGLNPDNATAEPANRRVAGKLPLKPKAWNHLKLALAGDTVTLHLNGVEIYRRGLESTNQRTFGLFYYADDTTMRVRNVTYRGQWPRHLPGADELWARKDRAGK